MTDYDSFIKQISKKAKHESREKLGKNLSVWILFVSLIVVCGLMITLIAWGFFSSLKNLDDFMANPLGLPSGFITDWSWSNYSYVFTNFKMIVIRTEGPTTLWFEDLFFNSLLYAVIGPLISTFTCCFMGYLIQRFSYKFSAFIYAFILVVMVIPLQGTASGMLRILNVLGLFDSFVGLWLQSFSFVNMKFLVFYAIYKSIPHDYEEAAYIDGANEAFVFIKIMFPMAKNIFITYFLLGFIANWNDWGTPLIYLPTHPTLAYGVYSLTNSTIQGFARTPMKMSTCFVSIIPTMILFIVFRDKIMSKISMGGVKE